MAHLNDTQLQAWGRMPGLSPRKIPRPVSQGPDEPGRRFKMSRLEDYEVVQQLGQGTFGVVSKARQLQTGKLVALKKFIVHDRKDGFPITSFREITIMRKLKHINVLQLIDMIHERTQDDKAIGYFYTVTPYISSDLNGLLNNPRVKMALPHIKCILQQVLQGIDYVHRNNYLHRDIKTANLLLDFFGVVKLADFGLARIYHGPPPLDAGSAPGGGRVEYTGLVVTRWYRPPELLLGERRYTTAVDMWGIGCVFGEMYKKRPILEGDTDLDQADRIFRLVGAPTPQNFPHAQEINRNNVNLGVKYQRSLEREFGGLMDPAGLRLLSGLLTLDPQRRFNARRALQDEYFTTEPLPCKPEDLPKFEESHESDIKRFKQERGGGGAGPSAGGGPGGYGSRGPSLPNYPRKYKADVYRPATWTAIHGRRREAGIPTAQVLPSAAAHSQDLYASGDQSFSAMKRYLHHETNGTKRQRKESELK